MPPFDTCAGVSAAEIHTLEGCGVLSLQLPSRTGARLGQCHWEGVYQAGSDLVQRMHGSKRKGFGCVADRVGAFKDYPDPQRTF